MIYVKFARYLVICLYLLQNVLLAAVYDAYKAHNIPANSLQL